MLIKSKPIIMRTLTIGDDTATGVMEMKKEDSLLCQVIDEPNELFGYLSKL
jgi:hypothetical protein